MSRAALKIEIPEDFQEFAEEQVREGKAPTVEAVVLDALEAKRQAAFDEAIEVGYRDLDAGRVTEWKPRESINEILEELGVPPAE